MAKSIDLTQQGRATPVPMQTPPPARPVNALPMNVGEVVMEHAGDTRMTPLERAAYNRQQHVPQPTLPPNVAAMVAAKQASPIETPLPLDFKPKIAETVDISQLSPTEQARVRQSISEVHKAHQPAPDLSGVMRQAPASRQVFEDVPTMRSQAVPGWKPATEDPSRYPAVTPQPGTAQLNTPVEMDLPEPVAAQPAAAPVAELSTFGNTEQLQSNCPHCDWPLHVPDIDKPIHAERQAYLQSILGNKAFMQDYSLMGGALRLRLRTLTAQEVDEIYKQAAYERDTNKIHSMEDFYEVVNRYRLYLQLQQLDGGAAFLHDYPEGLSLATNPNAASHWTLPTPDDPRATGLPSIADYITRTALTSETLVRVVQNTCGRFNRLVAKLEALIDNSDFWNQTGEQS